MNKLIILALCFTTGSSLSINPGYGFSDLFQIFGYTSNDIADIVDDEIEVVKNEQEEPPPHDQVAKMARYICHHSNWAAMATISSTEDPLTIINVRIIIVKRMRLSLILEKVTAQC